jgi:hypothetical protein
VKLHNALTRFRNAASVDADNEYPVYTCLGRYNDCECADDPRAPKKPRPSENNLRELLGVEILSVLINMRT